ncbi:MAG: ferritin [Gemmatimonadetes bacterium]|nr:ferritin [Gemmatimonadota bacterium]
MLISKAMNVAMNEQVGNELAASHQYIAIAVYFEGEGLPMLAKHFHAQSAEERVHAMRFVKFLSDASAKVTIPAIPAPRATFKSAEDAVRLALESEMRVTSQINALMDRAVKEGDHLSKNELEWFVREQREEVTSMDTLLRMVKRAGESGLFFVESFLLSGGMAGEAGAEGGAAG